MYIFNPENDLALANFNSHFTAPASARKMRNDLSILPVWYAPDGANVIAEGEMNNSFLEELKGILPFSNKLIPFSQLGDYSDAEVKPWGWSPALRKQLVQSGMSELLLSSLSEIETIRTYSGRQKAVSLLAELKVCNLDFCGESYFINDIEALLSYLNKAKGDQVLKMPYSGSGKGIVWLKNAITKKQTDWCKRVIKMQGGVVVEPALSKVQDFAMEFEMTDLGIRFVGYSLFQSSSSGAYIGNLLLSDADIEDRLSMYVERAVLVQLKIKLKTKLSEYFSHYRGYFGVDMMVCQSSELAYQLQPCVEVNMRMNMGVVAHSIFERFIHPTSAGLYSINYFKQMGEAKNHELTMQTNNPLVIEYGRIKSGFLSLTPVDKDTQYTASVSIKQNHEENS